MKLSRFSALTAGLALLAVCMLSSTAHSSQFIVNGSFEADPCTGSGFGYRLGLSGGDMSGWTIPATDGVYPWCLQNANAFGAGPAADGNQWLVLGETGASLGTPHDYTIQQTMHGLVSGDTYNLTFAISSEIACCAETEVSFLSGSSTGAVNFVAPAAANFWNPWGAESMNFTATSSDVTLQFKDLAVEAITPFAGADLGLDNVQVNGPAATPEPSSLLLVGSGLAGILLRRLRKA